MLGGAAVTTSVAGKIQGFFADSFNSTTTNLTSVSPEFTAE